MRSSLVVGGSMIGLLDCSQRYIPCPPRLVAISIAKQTGHHVRKDRGASTATTRLRPRGRGEKWGRSFNTVHQHRGHIALLDDCGHNKMRMTR